jgi:hypothetical protein
MGIKYSLATQLSWHNWLLLCLVAIMVVVIETRDLEVLFYLVSSPSWPGTNIIPNNMGKYMNLSLKTCAHTQMHQHCQVITNVGCSEANMKTLNELHISILYYFNLHHTYLFQAR